jgi:hypothetical protein
VDEKELNLTGEKGGEMGRKETRESEMGIQV